MIQLNRTMQTECIYSRTRCRSMIKVMHIPSSLFHLLSVCLRKAPGSKKSYSQCLLAIHPSIDDECQIFEEFFAVQLWLITIQLSRSSRFGEQSLRKRRKKKGKAWKVFYDRLFGITSAKIRFEVFCYTHIEGMLEMIIRQKRKKVAIKIILIG